MPSRDGLQVREAGQQLEGVLPYEAC